MMAIVPAGAFLEKFGGDGLEEIPPQRMTPISPPENLVAWLGGGSPLRGESPGKPR